MRAGGTSTRAGLSVSSVGSWALQRWRTAGWGRRRCSLSVSSVGSWALQLYIKAKEVGVDPAFSILSRIVGAATTVTLKVWRGGETFSILSRIVGAATTYRPRSPTVFVTLSVSSVGSWALQLRWILVLCPDLVCFQYPQSDRGRCNLWMKQVTGWTRMIFQYPQSDRGRCNDSDSDAFSDSDVDFQYPQSDRGRCNRRKNNAPAGGVRAFSILSRIVGAAT